MYKTNIWGIIKLLAAPRSLHTLFFSFSHVSQSKLCPSFMGSVPEIIFTESNVLEKQSIHCMRKRNFTKSNFWSKSKHVLAQVQRSYFLPNQLRRTFLGNPISHENWQTWLSDFFVLPPLGYSPLISSILIKSFVINPYLCTVGQRIKPNKLARYVNQPKSDSLTVTRTKDNPFDFKKSKLMGPAFQAHPEDNIILNTQSSRTIVITSGKGGVGKTTATANLGMSIARLGYRVALIDADIGLRNLDLLLGLENRILYTAMDILEGQCRLDQALIRDKRWKNLSLLSISKNRQRYNVTRKNMENLVKSISSLGYHFILIDCPAGIDVGFINAIAPAEEALIITTPEITAIRDADRVAGLLEANGIYNVKLLVNRVRPDMIQRNDMMSVRDVQEMLGIPLLGAIPEDNHVIISTNRGEPLVLKKKLTLSGIAFENAARRLIGKQDYFIDLAAPYKGVFQKVQELFFGL